MQSVIFGENYSYVGDVITLVICLILAIMLRTVYTIKGRKLELFKIGDIGLGLTAIFRIIFYNITNHLTRGGAFWAYLFYDLAYVGLLCMLYVYCTYLREVINLSSKRTYILQIVMTMLLAVQSFLLILSPVTKYGFYIDSNLRIHQSSLFFSPFGVGYIAFSLIAMHLLVCYRNRMITKMFYCIIGTAAISYGVMLLQLILGQSSFTTITYTFPIIIIMFLFHHNSYDIDTGMLDERAFNSYIKEKRHTNFSIIYLHLIDFDKDKFPILSQHLYHFNEQYFRDCITFRLADDRYAMVYDREKNANYTFKLGMVLEGFHELYKQFLIDYRLVLVDATPKLNGGEDYRGLFSYVGHRIAVNETHTVNTEDVDGFIREQKIIAQLHDITACGDMEDERVKVFCQPVLNTVTNTFTTAEALTRLELPELGMVYPNQFIPLAERTDAIHGLSKIILNKTCKQIREFQEKGLRIVRISVNFAISELKNPDFSKDVLQIIHDNRIPCDKLAFELTESRNEQDFANVKAVMEVLRAAGIKFYLDDYGTGYSNMERILGLPIDIIKFDRSLTILSGRDENSRLMVGGFADIFWKIGYQILFEGIEDESDESRCKEMHAEYLQGFKFSKPIPIEELQNFLDFI